MSPAFVRENGIASGTLEVKHRTKKNTYQYGLVRKGPWKPLHHGDDRKLQTIIL